MVMRHYNVCEFFEHTLVYKGHRSSIEKAQEVKPFWKYTSNSTLRSDIISPQIKLDFVAEFNPLAIKVIKLGISLNFSVQ